MEVFDYENQEKYPIYVSKKCCKEIHIDLLLIGEGEKNTIFLSMISMDSCMTITLPKKTFLSLLFTCFHYRRNIKVSY